MNLQTLKRLIKKAKTNTANGDEETDYAIWVGDYPEDTPQFRKLKPTEQNFVKRDLQFMKEPDEKKAIDDLIFRCRVQAQEH